jgi:hypothetical protein
MASTNLVISRLQEQRSRIHNMLSPGLQRQLGDSSHAPLSPVAPEFAGRKFQLAAKKMRVLEPRRLGQFQPESVIPLNTEIQNKFREPQKLIHIHPQRSRDTSIWSSVDTPLPGTTVSEGPAEPGVLRQGSIIQKMSTTPKPGQSLESFKQQIQSQSQHSQPKAAAKRPAIDANARRFSRIQEISPEQKTKAPKVNAASTVPEVPEPPVGQTAVEPETAVPQPESTPEESALSPEKTEATQKPKAEPPKAKPSVQRQVDQTPEELPLPRSGIEPPASKPSEEPAEKVVRPEEQEETPAAKAEDKAATQPGQVSSETPEIRQLAPEVLQDKESAPEMAEQPPAESRMAASSQAPADEVQPPKAAIPVKKEPSTPKTEFPLKKALPPKKEEPTITSPTARVQRQPEESVPSAQVLVVKDERAEFDEVSSTPTEVVETGSQMPDQPEAESQLPSENPEMPLQHQITYRQKAPKAVRAIEPEQLKPSVAPMLIHRVDEPLFMPVKHRSDATVDQRTETPSPSQFLSQTRTERSVSALREPQALPMDLPYEVAPQTSSVSRLSMPVVLTPPESDTTRKMQQPEQPTAPIQSDVTQQQPTVTGQSKASNVVQRLWEEHKELRGRRVGSQSSSQQSDRSEAEQSVFDLEALAEDVFPYVKRILEIEANRSSSDKF